jgi:hypothetical protein
MDTRTDVVLLLCNPDVIELMSFVLLRRNLSSCGLEPSEGFERMEQLIECRTPRVIVFDLNPPYRCSAEVVLRLLDRFPECSFLMTCADPALALKNAPWLSFHPLFQKPYFVDEIADSVGLLVG